MNYTLNQLIKKRKSKAYKVYKNKKKCHSPLLEGRPQKSGTCTTSVTIIKPKKPNSGNRKVIKVSIKMFNNSSKIKNYKKKYIRVYLRGEKPSLQIHSKVLLHGGRLKDLVGIKYKAIRGAKNFHFEGVSDRKNARSKYGTKKMKIEGNNINREMNKN